MGEVILTMPHGWAAEPPREAPLRETSLRLEFGGAEAGLAQDIRALATAAESLSPAELGQVDRHTGVLVAIGEVAGPGDITVASAGVRLAQAAFAAGAFALYVETGAKVLGTDAVRGIDPEDRSTLFHFYVEFVGDAACIMSEGMQAFGLPDVAVPYAADGRADSHQWATGAAFSLAAQMVVDGRVIEAGEEFRASESAPLYTVAFEPLEPDANDYVNPHGRWRLSPR